MIVRLIEEYPGVGRLGRHVAHDPRSREFGAQEASQIISVYHPARGLPLNQGLIGSCTAEALIGANNATPGRTVLHQKNAVRLYSDETALEGDPYPPNDPGGTGLWVCKAAKREGLITSYGHTFSLTSALKALVKRPVITGVNWYGSMDNPDGNGLVTISPLATVRGGHEIVATEIDVDRELVGFWQSWGRSWGAKGRFYMSFATWERLLHEDGDVTVPIFG